LPVSNCHGLAPIAGLNLAFAFIQALSGTSPDFFEDLALWQQTLDMNQRTRSAKYHRLGAYRKDHNNLGCALNDDGKIKPDLQALESFVDNNVLDLRRRNEGRRRCGEKVR